MVNVGEFDAVVKSFPIPVFICRTERILAQMPLFSKSLWLAFFAGCVALSSVEVQAQAARKAPPPAAPVAKQPVARQPAAPGKAALNQRQPLPQAQPLRIPKLDPQMEDILLEWEQKSSKVQRLEGTFEHTTYDKVWKIEKQSTGLYCFQFPDKGSFHQTGINHPEGKMGKLFPAKAGPNERWVCNGETIVKIDETAKQYDEFLIPKEDRGQNIRNSPLPFLFGMKANEAKQRYVFELNVERTNAKQIWLMVYPQLKQDINNYKKAEVILDRTTCLPIAVKLYDDLDPKKVRKEDVYFFPSDKMTINKNGWVKWLAGDPLKPNLSGYKKTLPPVDAAGAPAGTKLALPPEGRKSAALQPAIGRATLTTKSAPQRTAQLPEDDDLPSRATPKYKSRP